MTTLAKPRGSGQRLTHQLSNGLRVVVEEDHLTPAVGVNLWYGVGSRHEQPGRTGLAHLFEHLMFQGSAHVAPGEHFTLLDGLGSQLNATTSQDRTNYFETVPTAGLDLALWLEADRMGGLLDALDQTSLDNQRDVVRNERRQRYDNQPYGDAWEQLFAATFPPGHQYHHMPIGSMTDLAAATLDDVRDFFRRHYMPSNAVLSLVGDLDPEQALTKVERYFGGISSGGAPAAPRPQQLPDDRQAARIDVDDDVPLPAALLLWPVPEDGSVACDHLQLATHILAGAASSRLNLDLIRHRRTATSVSGSLDRLVGGHSALVLAAFGTHDTEPERLLEAIHGELAGFADRPPTELELTTARAAAEAGYLRATQDLSGRADSLSHGHCLFGDPGYDAASVRRLRTVTAEDICTAVATWLDPTQATVLTYRPAGIRAAVPPVDSELTR